MKRKFITTGDGSTTIHISEWNEQYHSIHGALQESKHVFLKMGLIFFKEVTQNENISILEIGFGTGLNALLTAISAENQNLKVVYTGVEAFPVTLSDVKKLNYPAILQIPESQFLELHQIPWEEKHQITPNFFLTKRKQFFSEISDRENFDLIYFDAFGARVQPELWTEAIFQKMYNALKQQAVLVTYAAKGSVRRAMQKVGFEVERLPGPPGKREMLRARKGF